MRISDLPASQLLEDLVSRMMDQSHAGIDSRYLILSASQRLALAVEAIRCGIDVEVVSRNLTWIEFESLAQEAFKANAFRVLKNLRFKCNGRRFQIDLLALKDDLGLVVDCKRWMRNPTSSLEAAGTQQIKRARSLGLAIENGDARLSAQDEIDLISVILTLADVKDRVASGALVVPIVRLKSFLAEFSSLQEVLLLSDEIDLKVINVQVPLRRPLESFMKSTATDQEANDPVEHQLRRLR